MTTENSKISDKEKRFLLGTLVMISLLTVTDLVTDLNEGALNWHLLIEATVGVCALFGIYSLLKGTIHLRNDLIDQQKLSAQLKDESMQWKELSNKYIKGLSSSIDNQLEKWKLTRSEKEVAFLLLKGLSVKEIAEIRKTTEKTTRAQSTSIYAKAGLSGRSQLAAFFLEDLLVPSGEDGLS